MKKLSILFLSILFAGQFLLAQTVDEARTFLFYGRTTSAQQTLEKILAANPKSGEAIYWLGQVHLQNDKPAAARKVYQDALNAGANDPLVWVGMGHVELLEGKKDAARQRFEAAITNSTEKKKKENVENVNVLNAIGRANADGPSTVGDAAYAVEKLKRAVQIDPNNAEAYINLGINYLKLGNDRGGDAYEAFTNALRIQPNNARAKYRLGKIFQSQSNAEKFLDYYNQAVTGDAAYAPGYLELYNYYANRDVNKAKEYLEKYIANSDKNCETEFFYADYLYRSGKYQESLTKAQALSSGICKDYPRMKVLYAYNYDRLGDSIQARSNMEQYLAAAAPDKVQPADYEFAGKLLLKFPGQEAVATSYLEKAMAADTTTAGKISYINAIIESLGKANQYAAQVKWYGKLAQLKPDLTARDLYFYSDAAIKADDLNTADTVARLYIQKYTDQPQGYAALAKAAIARDKDTTAGSAVPAVTQYIQWMEKTDKEKYKNTIVSNYGYLVALYANGLKNYPAALQAVDGILAVDPTNAYAQSTAASIRKVMSAPRQPVKQNSSKTPAKQAPKKKR